VRVGPRSAWAKDGLGMVAGVELCCVTVVRVNEGDRAVVKVTGAGTFVANSACQSNMAKTELREQTGIRRQC